MSFSDLTSRYIATKSVVPTKNTMEFVILNTLGACASAYFAQSLLKTSPGLVTAVVGEVGNNGFDTSQLAILAILGVVTTQLLTSLLILWNIRTFCGAFLLR